MRSKILYQVNDTYNILGLSEKISYDCKEKEMNFHQLESLYGFIQIENFFLVIMFI